ncbi:LOW QUALITY PROTEIN: CD226 antigen-like [Diadema setosum]|uniref:LOW QUALITY PROTEIN: CD226 antigen-like n=1 Tax=Diadema setosum TaxID=31175 RepID=UPI003B3A0815
MAYNQLLNVLITVLLHVTFTTSEHLLESAVGQNVTLQCPFGIDDNVAVRYWTYVHTTEPMSECKNQSLNEFVAVYPLHDVITYGTHVTQDLKSKLSLQANYDLSILNVSHHDAGCYKCLQIALYDNTAIEESFILTVEERNDPVLVAASDGSVESESGQDITLQCSLANTGDVQVQYWEYTESAEPLLTCGNQNCEDLVTAYPANATFEYGKHLTRQLKSRLIVKYDFSLLLSNITRYDSGYYLCSQILKTGQQIFDIPKILNVTNNDDSDDDGK